GVELAKLRHRLLNHPAANPHAAHKTPVTMDFTVLPYRRVAQVHALISTDPTSKENGDGWHYMPFPSQPAFQTTDLPQTAAAKKVKLAFNCSSWASCRSLTARHLLT